MDADDVVRSVIAGRPLERIPREALAGVRARAAFHGLSALVADRAEEAGAGWPADLVAGLRRDAERARRWCAMLDLELRRIAAAVPAGVAAPVVIKGPAVAKRYQDRALRSYVDIDLLVPEEELDAWRGPMQRLGYVAPGRWEEVAARRAHHHLVFTRAAGASTIPVELHWRLFAERRARTLDHEVIARHSQPDREIGLLVPSLPAQLVILAVHLAHHAPSTRKLMWYLDFVELGTTEAVGEGRRLAKGLGVGWALEDALHATELVLGEVRWRARPEVAPRGRLAEARARGLTGVRLHAAMARELGPVQGTRYLAGRLDPRRFRGAEGRFDWSALRGWAVRNFSRKR